MPTERTLSHAEAHRLLDAASEARALIVGDVMLDRYVIGTVDRISPEAPVPVVAVRRLRRAVGGAANVAAGIRRLGGTCRLVGAAGDDRAGAALRRLLERLDVPAELVSEAGRPTTVKTRILAHHQQVLRIDRERLEPVGEAADRELGAAAERWLEWANVLVLQDYDKGTLRPATARRLLAAAAARGIPAVVDPKLRHFFDFTGALVLKPNRRELAAALGVEEAPLDGESLAEVTRRAGCRNLLVTLGEEGMVLYESDTAERRAFPARAREVYDVSGAGDTVTAVLAACLAGGCPLRRATALANFAASLQVARLGARPVGAGHIRRALQGEASLAGDESEVRSPASERGREER